jgi:hypothetical protein
MENAVKVKVSSLIVTGAALLTNSAFAAEGAFYGGPVGGTDIRNAYLPGAPGFYGGLATVGVWADQVYGDNGKKSPVVTGKGETGGAAAALLYVYPFKILGGTVASAVQIAVAGSHVEINKNEITYFEFGDTYVDVLAWSKYLGSPVVGSASSGKPGLPYGATVKLAYSMILPTGKYSSTQLVSLGHNVFFYIPNAAVTYLTGPNFLGDGLEFSAHVFFDIASYNHATNYRTGPIYDIDAAITQRTGKWQYGVTGYYARQWEDDTQNGVPVPGNGKRLVAAAVGPVVAYDIPEWKANVKCKLQLPVYTRNGFATTRLTFVFSKAFQ